MGTFARIVKSVVYGYLGAILGGVLVAVIGIAAELSQESIIAVSVPTGVVFGTLGLSLIWWRPFLQRHRIAVRVRNVSRRHRP